MASYRKTATIEAVQFNKLGDHPAVFADVTSGTGYRIKTLEGGELGQEVTLGDYIATGIEGEHWPIKPDVFAATYERAEPTRSEPRESIWYDGID
jgi:hypothetical protein